MFIASRTPSLKTVLLATGVVLTLAMGTRHGFGFWMQPISQAHGWTRETYSLAQAMQNLMWGAFGPFAGSGGYLYASLGSYDIVWGIAIGLGVMAGLINLPINERPLARAELKAA